MSKIAITSEGPALDDLVDPRFGRAAGFVVVDLESMETRYIDNGQTQVMAQGAGIQAAELMAGAGVSCVLTGFVGPKAFQALSAARIRVVQNLERPDCAPGRRAIPKRERGTGRWAKQETGTMIVSVASGKGGTGKTTVAASLARVWEKPLIAVDLDVEEPNLHLFLRPDIEESATISLEMPVVDESKCTFAAPAPSSVNSRQSA